MNEKWWKNAVVYQIYPRSFKDSNGDGIGDLEGIYEKLDYLAELGIDVIWMSPVYKSPNDDNGYDISDYQDIMDDFGTMDDFDRVLKKAHSLNIKIMMDLVVNHTSDEHKWFIESKKSKDNPYHDYYMWADPDKNGNPPNRWESCFSGSAWEYVESVGQFYLHSFSRKQPDLNWDNPKVREEVFKMMTWWCDKGIDGFRMDVISMISKYPGLPDGPENGNGYTGNTSCDGPNIHKYLREMNEKVLSKYRLITVGECPGVNAEQAKKYANIDGSELDMIFQFEHVSGSALKPCHHGKWDGEAMTMPELRANFTKWQKDLEGCAWNSSRFGNDSEQYRELSAKMLATMTHFQKGTPYVYQGEELGMTNAYMENIADYRDIESLNAYKELTTKENIPAETVMGYIKAVGRDNARTPMQWDASENGGFTSGTPWLQVNKNYKTINAAAQVNDPDSVFAYYKKLIALRHTNEVMVNGVYDVLIPDHPQIYAYTRTLGDKQLYFATIPTQMLPSRQRFRKRFMQQRTSLSRITRIQTSPHSDHMRLLCTHGDHGDRDGGSKCVPTGSICVPKNIMILKKSESSRKELSGFFCVFIRMQSSRGKNKSL